MSPLFASLVALPLALAAGTALSNAVPDRHARHRDLASRQLDAKLDPREYHPQLGKRTLQPRAGQVPLGGFQEVGNSGVSAQMMFLGTADTVYILDSASSCAVCPSAGIVMSVLTPRRDGK